MGRFLLLISAFLIPFSLLALLFKRAAQNMAERFQQTPNPFPSLKGALLFLLPLPVMSAAVIALARGHVVELLGNAAGYGLFLAGRYCCAGVCCGKPTMTAAGSPALPIR